ncbi:unnamed protein product [Clonostachys byssicola]|uniref:Uncharacterized protein n=1 Tax=Clonostachys byssicola TaxID=160290 RepID=A0A9N9XXC8_9HYPO|nr:unnamed protein product [Clonostachys byssicola]
MGYVGHEKSDKNGILHAGHRGPMKILEVWIDYLDNAILNEMRICDHRDLQMLATGNDAFRHTSSGAAGLKFKSDPKSIVPEDR